MPNPFGSEWTGSAKDINVIGASPEFLADSPKKNSGIADPEKL